MAGASETEMQGSSRVVAATASDGNSAVKTRAACDECRQKKLKCSGDRPACTRCVREGITCVYSPQKPMGRPKKRSRSDGETGIDDLNERNSNGSRRVSNNDNHVLEHMVWDSRKTSASSTNRGRRNGSMNLGTGFGLPHSGAFDMSSFDQALTPGGSLQPWLQNAEGGWDYAMDALQDFNGGIPPELTPDMSSEHSPPNLGMGSNGASDLHLHEINQHSQQSGIDNYGIDVSTNMLLDPALAALPSNHNPDTIAASDGANLGLPSTVPACACLSTMYLTLNSLQNIEASHPFPYALHPLREAMQTASEVISCTECPSRFITCMQNTHLLGALLVSISERFGKVLQSINSEADRAECEGTTKKFRLADLNTMNSHLHTGGLGCAAAFSIDLSPQEWRSMSKKVVRAEVDGPSQADQDCGHESCVYLKGVLKKMRARQIMYHEKPEEWLPEDFPKDSDGHMVGGPRGPGHGVQAVDGGEHVCLKMVRMSDRIIEGFDWS